MAKSKRKSISDSRQELGPLERVELYMSQDMLGAVRREAGIWGLSLHNFILASIAGSLVISQEEKG